MRNPTHKKLPSKRVWSRRCAAQALYEWQLAGGEPARIAAEFLAHQDLGKADLAYFRELVEKIPLHVTEIDAALAPFLDRPPAQVDPVECAILRIGGYELMQRPDINHRVAINEAVELAKIFGAEQGHRFVNGVLDKLARAVRPNEFAVPT
ncbi:MAG: transcription antitermination factor NusB [Candidatus Competibacter denitrificans]|uniref:Transcription antitermination protein NusB n=1 Tax=Candidatus Competibacter denitrificans Run_A_D11 TaxID=1400863 RepID=W6M2S3_9GAMM|nr:transcription antitermination factor NusB [Candidatus Competibacter denitrificans]CDI01817.1 transcription termination; L factor [Candidatus Competibacter denitrificans Run_A_D11]HAS86906.1 transcription antitermination factor NusB [Candidatus Competibacteraceae bacterium]HRC68044.1 transcription antitermination factor NusB [Candidatus Competibacter denitrificans]